MNKKYQVTLRVRSEIHESPDRKGLSGRGERGSEGLLKPSQEPRCGPQPLGGSIAAMG